VVIAAAAVSPPPSAPPAAQSTAPAATQPTVEHDYDDEEVAATQAALGKYLDPTAKGYVHGYMDDNLDKERDAIVANLPKSLTIPVEKKRRILVISYNVDIHAVGAAGFLYYLRAAEKKYDAFALTEVNTIKGIDAKTLSGYDAVILNDITKTWSEEDEVLLAKNPPLQAALDKYYHDLQNHPDKRDPALRIHHPDSEINRFTAFKNELLPTYLKNGGGLLVIHGSLQVFGGSLLGGHYGGHAMGPAASELFKNGYGLKIVEPTNPLAKAFVDAPDTKLSSELYIIIPAAQPDVKADAFRPIVAIDELTTNGLYKAGNAIIALKWYGKGRVYYCGIGGHQWKPYAVPAFSRALLDGIEYLTRDLSVPPMKNTDSPAGN